MSVRLSMYRFVKSSGPHKEAFPPIKWVGLNAEESESLRQHFKSAPRRRYFIQLCDDNLVFHPQGVEYLMCSFTGSPITLNERQVKALKLYLSEPQRLKSVTGPKTEFMHKLGIDPHVMQGD